MSRAERLACIEREGSELPLTVQADLLGISRRSLYDQPKEPAQEEVQIKHRIDAIYTEMPYYGSRRMTAQLQQEGYGINRKAVQRHMREMGIRAIYPGPNLSRRAHQAAVYPYLLRHITPGYPNHVWAIDITYIRLSRSWLYLVAVIDWYSRYIVSWALDDMLGMPFVLDAVDRALEQATPVIWNSDQGSQFTSPQYRDRLLAAGVRISMDGKGRALDNVIIERFWRNLKYDDVYLKGYTTPRAARQGIADYMQRYNEIRLHQALDYQTPGSVYRGDVQLSDGKTTECG
jgi:putative transposase